MAVVAFFLVGRPPLRASLMSNLGQTRLQAGPLKRFFEAPRRLTIAARVTATLKQSLGLKSAPLG
jgi:hypothetical protein